MDKFKIISLALLTCVSYGPILALSSVYGESANDQRPTISLPPPDTGGKISVEEAIYQRKSVRSFRDEALTLKQASQLLWAAGGKTIDGTTGATRSYPSAGGIYPLEIYLLAGKVEGISPGIYRYNWSEHSLKLIKAGDLRRELAEAAWGQDCVARAPASLIITAAVSRTVSRYGERGEKRYLPMDAGHVGQNVHLQAGAMGLGTVMVGAFEDEMVKSALGIENETPFYIMPLGKP